MKPDLARSGGGREEIPEADETPPPSLCEPLSLLRLAPVFTNGVTGGLNPPADICPDRESPVLAARGAICRNLPYSGMAVWAPGRRDKWGSCRRAAPHESSLGAQIWLRIIHVPWRI